MLTLGARRCYIVGAYFTTNNMLAVHCVDQVLKAAPEVLEIILMGGVDVLLREPRDKRKEDLATALADKGMISMIDHFMPLRRYRVA